MLDNHDTHWETFEGSELSNMYCDVDVDDDNDERLTCPEMTESLLRHVWH